MNNEKPDEEPISERKRKAIERFRQAMEPLRGDCILPERGEAKNLWEERNYARLEDAYRRAPEQVNEETPFRLLKMLSKEKAKGGLPTREEEWSAFYTDVLERVGATDYTGLLNTIDEFDNAISAKKAEDAIKRAEAAKRKKIPKAILYCSGNKLYTIPIKDGKPLENEETLIAEASAEITGIDTQSDRWILYSCKDSHLHELYLKSDNRTVLRQKDLKVRYDQSLEIRDFSPRGGSRLPPSPSYSVVNGVRMVRARHYRDCVKLLY